MAANATASVDLWMLQILAEDFAASCKEDRFCVTCAAAFCDHCCAHHHRGPGHEVVVRAAAASGSEGSQPGVGPGRSEVTQVRDSFCLDCAAGFSAALCTHHGGHETVRIVVCEGRHCIRCTGSEPWFPWLHGIETYEDEQGHKLVPLHPRGPHYGRARCAHCGRALCFLFL
ncbi:hypothetical protein QOZ80_3BG0279260 [Eleusine coracana subsp. coracana]|nr:hypothetical protein QOZ80_3BG0279260 [Eleusine coracana subsp. coracana]